MPGRSANPDTVDMAAGSVTIAIDDPGLAKVLAAWLKDVLGRPVCVRTDADRLSSGDVMLTTTGDTDPVSTAELVGRGVRVIVLAPVIRPDEAARYRRGGAQYFPMSLDNNDPLAQAIQEALDAQSPPAIAFRAIPCHPLSP